MTQLTLSGALLKAHGLALVEDSNASFVATMRELAKGIALVKGEVCSDDLRQAADQAGLKPAHPNAWGCILRGKEWREVGRKHSVLASNHYRKISVFQWVQR